MNSIQLGTKEQLIRYALTWIGSVTFGASVANGELYQAAVGGAIAVGTFVWWYVRNRQVKV